MDNPKYYGTAIFKILDDKTISVRTGSQHNCSGMAIIQVKITARPQKEICFQPAQLQSEPAETYGFKVAAAAIPQIFRQAAFDGAREAFDMSAAETGINFELLSATVHEVDANQRRFKEAGFVAVKGWLELARPKFS